MRKISYKKLFTLFCLFAALFILPSFFVEKFRSGIISLFNPLFRFTADKKHKDPIITPKKLSDYHKLQSENLLLRSEIEMLKDLIDHQSGLENIAKELEKSSNESCCESYLLYGLSIEAIAARVIYRDPGNWRGFLWVDVGIKTNKKLNKTVVSLNSPVIIGDCIVGLIDYVGEKQSRVRLITDSKLHPAVRTVRGSTQKRTLVQLFEHIQTIIKNEPQIFNNVEEVIQLCRLFEYLKQKITIPKKDLYFGKGILEGAVNQGNRSNMALLKGSGFNYDFFDDEGGAKDLKTGFTQGSLSSGLNSLDPLIKEGDLLITSGMDGVFPKGFKVATVTKVYPLKEGNYTYDIEALSLIPYLEELQTVFIIPALSFNFNDLP